MDDDNQNSLPPGTFPRENRFLALVKNILVFVVLLGIVLASFIVSFQLGKKILMPSKKAPEKITAAIPEPPPSLKSLQKLQAIMSSEATKKPARKSSARRHHKHYRRTGRAYHPVARGHYYKIEAGLFPDKDQADALAEKMKTSGIAIYIKPVGDNWRVQAGAYRLKAQADKAKAEIASKGFESKVIFE